MKVLIEARSLAAKSGGIKSYTYELIKHLLREHGNDSIELLYGNRRIQGTFPDQRETVIPLRSELLLSYWMSFPVASYVRETNPSVVHYTKTAMPYTKTVPTVVTMYDIIPVLLPETQSPLRRLYWPYVLKHVAKKADHIMTISNQSKRDIMERYGTPEDKITVTPLAVDTTHFTPSSEKAADPYILFVGTRDKRKNIATLIKAFNALADVVPHRLIIVGRPGDKDDGSRAVAAHSKYADRIEFRENVSYDELPLLYSQADLFVWPSAYEGWGFPPQEAMACGTPVIVSDGGPLPEVVGDAGIVISFTATDIHGRMDDTEFTSMLSEKMKEVLESDELKRQMIQKGLVQAKKFSWVDLAEKTWNVYSRISS